MSAFTPRHASARIRASRGLALIVFIAFSRGSLAASQLCEDKTITRKSIAKLTRSARFAIVQLDVLVERDNVVAASLSATARGNFGGSDNEAKWADVETSGAKRLRCEGGEASQCSAWYDCGDASDATADVVDGVLTAAVTISDAVEFDYCPNGGLAEVEVSVDFTVRRCEPAPAPTPRPTPAAPPSAKRKKRSSAPAAFELTMAIIVLTVAGVGFLLACFCFMRARAAQDQRVDEIMKEADEINRKADAAVSSSRSSRSGDV